MAVVGNGELDQIRQEAAAEVDVDYLKGVANQAVQAIEDWWESTRVDLSAAIDAATDPVVLSNAQKRALAKHWMRRKAARGG